MFLQTLFSTVDERVDLVFRFDHLLLLGICLGIDLRILDHAFDVIVRQSPTGFDNNVLFLARALIFRRNIENAICINVERDLNLGHTARGRRDASKVELAQILVIRRHFTLSLHDLELHLRLVVHGRGESLLFLRGDGGISWN
mmetsp:Transcript_34800/g.84091  ORF Transcript_34800/g.84091 Transcript_34800/m.84091 type:complete len:143 (+) Transcript_34800:455-883(+)